MSDNRLLVCKGSYELVEVDSKEIAKAAEAERWEKEKGKLTLSEIEEKKGAFFYPIISEYLFNKSMKYIKVTSQCT